MSSSLLVEVFFRLRFAFCVRFWPFCSLMFTFVVLRLVSSVLSQETDWEEHVRNDVFLSSGT